MLPSLGLLGRLVAIVLLTVLVEFGISTALYERVNQYAVRDDEARRLAEHLVISRRLVAARVDGDRAAMARALTTDRYLVRWEPALPPPPAITPEVVAMRQQIVAWEPSLVETDLRLRLTSPGRRSVIVGGLRLADRSWMYFRTLHPVAGLNIPIARVLLALVPAIALILLALVLLRRALYPLRRLAEVADRIGIGGDEQVPEGGTVEVRRLVVAFNSMQGRIRRLIDERTQSLAAVGHDLRTPLARLRLRSEEIDRPDLRESIERDVLEMDAMVTSLLVYLGGGSPEPRVPIDVAVMCSTLVDDALDQGARAEYRGPDHLEVALMPTGLKRAVANLVDNAVHFGEYVVVTLEDRAASITIRVEDDGPGIPPESLETVLEPFVRLDMARQRDTIGFGLGLSIVAQAVEAQGGTLTLANRAAGGLVAEMVLPKQPASQK
jgi:signal transduction histidine kinase